MLSLINDPWLPVRLRDGSTRRIRPAELGDEAILDLAYPRADFQGAGYQFLIGLLQTTLAPEDEEEWEEAWDAGFDGQTLETRFAQVAQAFAFGAEKPAFMQDMASLEGESLSIANLLIEAPGGNTLKLNKDHFIKRGQVARLCPCCAAMALFTLQINAPSGGQGHRTSLRGGGPMTSLVWPQDPNTPLWRRLWLNVLTQEVMSPAGQLDAAVFPWLAETRTSETAAGITTPEIVHPLQVYWGMPRRIELDFSQLEAGRCDLCGEASSQLLVGYRTKNYGVQYDGWRHPLTPYRQAVKDPEAPLLSVKGQPGGLLYRDWLGLLWQGVGEQNRELPARVVLQAQQLPIRAGLGLWCFGYDMDNMKARCWYEHQLPLPCLDERQGSLLAGWLRLAVQAASEGVYQLKGAVKAAWNSSPKDARGDFGFIDIAFWQETEPGFQQLLTRLMEQAKQPEPQLQPLSDWGRYLRRQLLQRFDDLVFSSPEQALDLSRELNARKFLFAQLNKSKAFKTLSEFKAKEVA